MRRVVFINRFYWPEETATAQLLTDLTTALAGRDFQVEVITSRTGRMLKPRDEHQSVRISRLGATRLGRSTVPAKLVEYVWFLIRIAWHLLSRRHFPDTIVVLSDPPMLGAVVWLVTCWRRVAVIHWVQDIYPEIAVELGSPRLLLLLRPLRNLAWRRARACVAPGATMAGALKRAGVRSERILVSPNWALTGLAPAGEEAIRATRARLGLRAAFIAAYSGNLGRVHDLEPLLAVAEKLRDDSDFALLLVGGGAQRDRLEAQAVGRNLANVHFFPAQARSEIAAVLSAADVHFVTLKPGAERWVFPSKLYGIARVGRPVIFVGTRESETGRLVEEHGLGRAFAPEQVAEIVNELRLLRADAERGRSYAENARAFQPHGFGTAVDQWTAQLGGKLATAGANL